MDENKNQNTGYDFSYDSENNNSGEDRYSNTVPAWMINSGDDDEEETEDSDSFGHETLTDDQDGDIDKYEDEKKNPFESGDSEESEDSGDNAENDDNGESDDETENVFNNEEEEESEENSDNVNISKSKVILIKKLLANIKDNSDKLNRLLSGFVDSDDEERINISEASEGLLEEQADDGASKIIEGVFDGENMIGPDGKQYSVPSNYASKSKLVEGDLLKLTITQKGTFVYKQIKPIERERVIGVLEKAADGSHLVVSGVKRWRILTASVTYFKGDVGDEAVILVPRGSDSKWAAVENIIRSR